MGYFRSSGALQGVTGWKVFILHFYIQEMIAFFCRTKCLAHHTKCQSLKCWILHPLYEFLYFHMLLCEHPFQSCDFFYFPFTKIDGTEIRSGHGLVILFPQQNDLRSVWLWLMLVSPMLSRQSFKNCFQWQMKYLLSLLNCEEISLWFDYSLGQFCFAFWQRQRNSEIRSLKDKIIIPHCNYCFMNPLENH